MTFCEALVCADELDRVSREAARALRAIPGVGTGPLGLTPDSVKASPEYRAARAASDAAFSRLREFNAWFTRTYAREYREFRASIRAASSV